MGQVWSKANFDGTNNAGHLGGRGSLVAVTAQNPGPDGQWDTDDDVLARVNQLPVDVSIDVAPNDNGNELDRVRGFISFHPQTCNFVFADGSTHAIDENISPSLYRAVSTRDEGEIISHEDL